MTRMPIVLIRECLNEIQCMIKIIFLGVYQIYKTTETRKIVFYLKEKRKKLGTFGLIKKNCLKGN